MSTINALIDKYRSGPSEEVLALALKAALERIECAHTSAFYAECKTGDKDEILDHLEAAKDEIRAILEGTYNESCGAI